MRTTLIAGLLVWAACGGDDGGSGGTAIDGGVVGDGGGAVPAVRCLQILDLPELIQHCREVFDDEERVSARS